MDFHCAVEDDGDAVRVTALPIDTGSGPWRIWLVFDPAITGRSHKPSSTRSAWTAGTTSWA
jgi:hypothetical protein